MAISGLSSKNNNPPVENTMPPPQGSITCPITHVKDTSETPKTNVSTPKKLKERKSLTTVLLCMKNTGFQKVTQHLSPNFDTEALIKSAEELGFSCDHMNQEDWEVFIERHKKNLARRETE